MKDTRANDRAKEVALAGRVKLHLFEPSMRRIMTVVGKQDEHWVDIGLRFCSCSGFYFATTRGAMPDCYHLKSSRIASGEGTIDVIRFDDAEFDGFVHALLHEM